MADWLIYMLFSDRLLVSADWLLGLLVVNCPRVEQARQRQHESQQLRSFRPVTVLEAGHDIEARPSTTPKLTIFSEYLVLTCVCEV